MLCWRTTARIDPIPGGRDKRIQVAFHSRPVQHFLCPIHGSDKLRRVSLPPRSFTKFEIPPPHPAHSVDHLSHRIPISPSKVDGLGLNPAFHQSLESHNMGAGEIQKTDVVAKA